MGQLCYCVDQVHHFLNILTNASGMTNYNYSIDNIITLCMIKNIESDYSFSSIYTNFEKADFFNQQNWLDTN